MKNIVIGRKRVPVGIIAAIGVTFSGLVASLSINKKIRSTNLPWLAKILLSLGVSSILGFWSSGAAEVLEEWEKSQKSKPLDI